MTRRLACCLALLWPLSAGAADKVTKETFGSGGRTRTYYLLIPETAKKSAPPPLIVLLRGSGRDGKSLIDPWAPLAKKEGFVIVAPDAMTPQGWARVPEHGPDFLHDLVELRRASALPKAVLKGWHVFGDHLLKTKSHTDPDVVDVIVAAVQRAGDARG